MGDEQGISEHTGFPNPATDTSLRSLDLNQLLVKHPSSTFYMRISGNTWEEKGIFDSDIVLVDRALEPKPTDVVIWWQDDVFTLSTTKHVSKDIEVWGIITTIIHQVKS